MYAKLLNQRLCKLAHEYACRVDLCVEYLCLNFLNDSMAQVRYAAKSQGCIRQIGDTRTRRRAEICLEQHRRKHAEVRAPIRPGMSAGILKILVFYSGFIQHLQKAFV